MNISTTDKPAHQEDADAVVVGLYDNGDLSGGAKQINDATGGLLSQLMERKEAGGKPFEIVTLYSPPGVKAPLVMIVGCGPRDQFNRSAAYRCAGAAAKALAGRERGRVAFYLDADGPADRVASAVAGAIAGAVGQDLYRVEKKRFEPREMAWATRDTGAVERGRVLGESINLTRRLVNEPPDRMYPESFANRADEVAQAAGLKIEVWDKARLEKERCGSLLAVAKGSDRPPRLVIVRHNGGQPGAPTLALVGKGVTFDSGGYSLKPSDGMLTMKCDMAGAATVLGAMNAIARLKVPRNVVGLVGLVENMVNGSAMKLGDVLTARNGRTIEIHNTDAEGRLVLADVLSVAVDLKADRIIDLATLTGACMVALGNDVAGLMTNDSAWGDVVQDASVAAGEPAWPLPMYDDFRLTRYGEHIRSEVADIKNVGDGRWGGAITAAKFLEEFVAKKPWVHLDIAGPAFWEKPRPWIDSGATGMFVQTLVDVAAGGGW